MILFIILWTAVVGLLFFKKEHNIWNPGCVFNIFWFAIAVLVFFRWQDLLRVSEEIYFLVFIGMLFFSLGVWSSKINFISKKWNRCEHQISAVRTSAMFLLSISGLAIWSYRAIKLLLTGNSVISIRYILSGKIIETAFEMIYMKFVVSPIVMGYVVICISSAICKKKFDMPLMVRALLLSVLDFISFGDRLVAYMWFVGIMLILVKIIKWDEKARKRLKTGCLFLMALIFITLVIRAQRIDLIIGGIYGYFCGGLVYLTKQWERISTNMNPTYFVSSYQGLLRPVMGVLELVGVKWTLFETATDFLMENQHTAVSITNSGRGVFNYFTTCFGYFYYDFKLIGVILNTFVWGRVSKIIYNKAKNMNDYVYVGWYIFVLFFIMMSFVNYAFVEVTIAWGLVFFTLSAKKKGTST